MHPALIPLKDQLNFTAQKIRKLRKEIQLAGQELRFGELPALQHNKHLMSVHFRHHHIAYCEVRGLERAQIEDPSEHNKPDENLIDDIRDFWIEKIQQYKKDVA